MGVEEEIEKILGESKFINKREFIEKEKTITSSDLSQIDVDGWKETLGNEKKMGDFWEFMENMQWFFQNLKKLKEMYGGKVVLIYNQDVIFANENGDEVINKINSLGLERNQCYACYIPKPEEDSLLSIRRIQDLKAPINMALFLFPRTKTGSNIVHDSPLRFSSH